MKLTAQVKLLTSEEQAQALRETLARANAACDFISDYAWEHQTFRQYDLHRKLYYSVRERFGLSAQMVVRCEAKVADAYKLDRSTKRSFRPTGSIAYDDRILSWQLVASTVSIWTLAGRQTIPFVCGERQRELLRTRQGESDLAFRDGTFFVFATCNVEEPDPIDIQGVLGIDLGIVEIAVDSEGHAYSGEPVKAVRRRMKRIRSLLQSKGTRSAKRHLRKINRRQSSFTRNTNHVISKQIVQTASVGQKAIGIEDLKHIRDRSNGYGKAMRWLMGNWAFDELGQFLQYKAALAGLCVIKVDPRNTSRTCSVCGYCDKANRTSQAHFHCLQCGHDENADANASRNIAVRAEASLPNVPAHRGTSPRALAVGC